MDLEDPDKPVIRCWLTGADALVRCWLKGADAVDLPTELLQVGGAAAWPGKGHCVMDSGEWSGRGVSGARDRRDGSVGTGLSGSSACTNVRAVAAPTPTICMLASRVVSLCIAELVRIAVCACVISV